MNDINIYQRNWAFTSKDAEKPQIRTGSFGPCYVVTFTSGRFAAMAHIDDLTDVNSMRTIFNKFNENSVELSDVKVIILGGWKSHSESFKWGNKVVKKIEDAGFKNVNTQHMYSKKAITAFQVIKGGISQSEIPNHYYLGALVDARNGKTFLIKEVNKAIEDEQTRQLEQIAEKYGSAPEEYPLTQIQ